MKRLLAILLIAIPAFATRPTTTIFQIMSAATASNVNGGGFDPAATMPLNDLACTSATGNAADCTSGTYTFVAGDANGWLFIQSGTGGQGWYPQQFCLISSVSAGHAILNSTAGSCVIFASGRWGPTTVAGVSSNASPTGGVFAVDFSQQTAAEFAAVADGGSVTTSTTFTSLTSTFRTVMPGNYIHITTTGTGAQCVVGWYAISSVTDATNVVLDRGPSAGTGCVGATFYLGGALSLGSSDDAIFELATTSATSSTTYFIQGSNTYALGGGVSISVAGNASNPITVEGFASVRGDRPVGSTRPILSAGTSAFVSANTWRYRSLQFTASTGTPTLTTGTNTQVLFTKVSNTGTGANTGILLGASGYLFEVEASAIRGFAVSSSSFASTVIENSYIHDSSTGFIGSSGSSTIINTIISGNYTNQVSITSTGIYAFMNVTLYGAQNQISTCLALSAGVTNVRVINSIYYGCATSASHGDTGQAIGISNYNDVFNSGAATNWPEGPQSVAVDPQFVGVAQITGTGGTSATTTLTVTGANLSTVTDNVDFVYISSATTATVGKYLITAHDDGADTLTLSPSPGTGSNIVWEVTTGHNFAIGTNLKALGSPGAFPAALTTGYIDIGAAQRQEAGGSGGQKGFTWMQ